MKKSILVAALLSSLSLGAVADTPTFNFVEFGKAQLDVDGTSIEPDGYEFDFNFELSENYYLSADYTDVDDQGVDLEMTNLGFGFKTDVSDSTALFTQIDWANIESNAGIDEDGYRLGIGIRSNVSTNFEVTAAYEYLDIDDETSDFYILGAAYRFTDSLALYTDYKKESDVDQLSLGLRFEF